MDREFNLIDEPWIRVIDNSLRITEVSIKECLLNAHSYKVLYGEMQAQNTAVLRFLIAILYSTFARVNAENEEEEIDDIYTAMERWAGIWELKRFPSEPVTEYLDRYHDRFWLIDKDRPFYQIHEAAKGTDFKASKLNAVINKSNNENNTRIFTARSGIEMDRLTLPEAARWLLFNNGFDDMAAKAKDKGDVAPGVGYLGKLGLIEAVGSNLFETLMLNLTFLKNGSEVWEPIKKEPGFCAVWELDKPRTEERILIPQPSNLAALYTLQSRRNILEKEGSYVIGYKQLSGEKFPLENAFAEQMTLWGKVRKKDEEFYLPMTHDPSRQMWREFSTIAAQEASIHSPGILSWICVLRKNDILNEDMVVRFRTVSINYDTKKNSLTDEFGDELDFSIKLLEDAGNIWQERICKEIHYCEKIARKVSRLAIDLEKASGRLPSNSPGTKKNKMIKRADEIDKQNAKEIFYARIDSVFRNWLYELDPEKHDEGYIEPLRKEVLRTAMRIGREMVERAGPKAFCGRTILEVFEDTQEKKFFSSPSAYNEFIRRVNSTYKEVKNSGFQS